VGQRRRALTPGKSTLHLWGSELRAWRDRRGLSLADLRDLIRYDASYLARLERAEQFPSEQVAEACDHALGSGGELMRLWHMADDERRHADGHVANQDGHVANTASTVMATSPDHAPWELDEEITVPVRRSDGRIIFVDVPRRLFLGGLGTVALGATAGTALSGCGAGPAVPPGMMSGRKPAEHFLRVRQALRDSDNLFGPRQVIPAAVKQVNSIKRVLQSTWGSDRQELLRVQTQFADLLGWLHQDSGDYRASQYWMDRALEWSHMTGDHDSVVFILARKSQLAGDMRDSAEAAGIGDAALSQARPRTRLGAVAATYAAHGYALQGDRAACERLYDRARSLLAQADDDKDSPWATFFDESYIGVQRAHSLAALGDAPAAADGFRGAIDHLQNGYHRDRGVYLAREALAYAGAGEADHAAALGLEALGVGAETNSGRIFTDLAQLDSQLGPWQSAPEVAQFRAAMNEIVLQQA
jgi:tetratricopeptide (TPR) repeat protein